MTDAFQLLSREPFTWREIQRQHFGTDVRRVVTDGQLESTYRYGGLLAIVDRSLPAGRVVDSFVFRDGQSTDSVNGTVTRQTYPTRDALVNNALFGFLTLPSGVGRYLTGLHWVRQEVVASRATDRFEATLTRGNIDSAVSWVESPKFAQVVTAALLPASHGTVAVNVDRTTGQLVMLHDSLTLYSRLGGFARTTAEIDALTFTRWGLPVTISLPAGG